MTLHDDWSQSWFNAHCHLELGHLRGAIPPGLPFVEWLERVVALKRAAVPEEVRAAVAAGLVELRSRRTRALLDIDSLGIAPTLLEASPESAISFTEIISFDPALGNEAVKSALATQAATDVRRLRFGLSPHAPYSTTARLLRAAVEATRQRDQWLCIHAAETPEEVALLTQGTGALRDFLDARGLLGTEWQPPRLRPVEYLAEVGTLGPKTLLVHLNEITDAEIALLAETGTRAVVCPGTHVYFDRGAFPLGRLLRGGVTCYLGTDSLASNECLDMGREVALAAELAPDVPRERIVEMAAAERAADFGLGL